MSFISVTERTIAREWNREKQDHDETVVDNTVTVNSDAIAFYKHTGDAPSRYATHIHLRTRWDLFVIETPGQVEAAIRRARQLEVIEDAQDRASV
jgi:hypothetical protein